MDQCRVLCLAALALALGTGVGAQVPTTSQTQEIQERVKKLAEEKGEELAFRLRGTLMGALGPEGTNEVRRWDGAVRVWKKEKGAGAAPVLAEGVLFDCLSRLQGVKTPVLSSEKAVPYFLTLAEKRPSRAAQAFETALKIDPSLVEARMRAARVRAPKDSQAARELERLAEGAERAPFPYLAAMSRAEAAQAQQDVQGALRWYERAVVIEPRSTAAAIALRSHRPGAAVAFADLRTDDPYYSYPCTVLTPAVAAALRARVNMVVLK
jgi:tetratricopeptide (TPR) repeat protein